MILLQLLFNSIVSGIQLALMAAGFHLIFNTTKVFHLAHAAVYTCSTYTFLILLSKFDTLTFTSVALPAAGSFITAILLSALIEFLVYLPMARRHTTQAITLIASIGINIFLENLAAMLYGNQARYFPYRPGISLWHLPITITFAQELQLFFAALLLGGLFFLSRGRLFLQVRAVMSQAIIASTIGINTNKIRLLCMMAGSILAAMAGMLRVLDAGIYPSGGMGITLSAAAAVIIGGGRTLKATIMASLLVASLQTATEWWLSSQWKNGITFLLLIAVLLWKTEGIVSFKMRIEEK